MKGKEGYKIAVQCKRWKRDVGNDIVLRLKAGKQIYGCYDAWIITTSNFTKAAREAAEPLRIRLINGLTVHDMITRWRKDAKHEPHGLNEGDCLSSRTFFKTPLGAESLMIPSADIAITKTSKELTR
ncbi:restriction endonuclease [Brevibacillus marinus]|uniref:restriction endonuclease n=1 Tax=Brevibacillus marinus TaxID=2496837 RepID=UPI001F4933B8|nr:restriction endonuclease [Brevibacillus marinus]